MSLAVVSAGGAPAIDVSTNLLAGYNLTSAQSAQIEQILSQMQAGMISPVVARAQIAGIVSSPQQSAPSSTPSAPAPTAPAASANTSGTPAEPLQSYYELPLPQESLKGALPTYTSAGAATQTVFSAASTVNAHA